MTDCIFCKIITGELPSERVYEDEVVLAFLDIAPVNPGHTLLIPKAHVSDLLTVDPADMARLVQALPKVARAVVEGTKAEGFNASFNNGAAAGQIVWHLHCHIIPRFASDGYRSWGHRAYVEGEAAAVADKIRAALAGQG